MICKCGDSKNSHNDNGSYFGSCNMCACTMFDVYITPPVIRKRRVVSELDNSEWPRERKS